MASLEEKHKDWKIYYCRLVLNWVWQTTSNKCTQVLAIRAATMLTNHVLCKPTNHQLPCHCYHRCLNSLIFGVIISNHHNQPGPHRPFLNIKSVLSENRQIKNNEASQIVCLLFLPGGNDMCGVWGRLSSCGKVSVMSFVSIWICIEWVISRRKFFATY